MLTKLASNAGIYLALKLTRARTADLHRVRQVSYSAVENGGTTLRDYVNVEGKQGRNQQHLVLL